MAMGKSWGLYKQCLLFAGTHRAGFLPCLPRIDAQLITDSCQAVLDTLKIASHLHSSGTRVSDLEWLENTKKNRKEKTTTWKEKSTTQGVLQGKLLINSSCCLVIQYVKSGEEGGGRGGGGGGG